MAKPTLWMAKPRTTKTGSAFPHHLHYAFDVEKGAVSVKPELLVNVGVTMVLDLVKATAHFTPMPK